MSAWSVYNDDLVRRTQMVACPACGSDVAVPCLGPRGFKANSTHYLRRYAAMDAGFLRDNRPLYRRRTLR